MQCPRIRQNSIGFQIVNGANMYISSCKCGECNTQSCMCDCHCKDLYDLITDQSLFSDPNYATRDGYWRWEARVTEYLKSKNLTVLSWFMIESDSFGPLIRGCRIQDAAGVVTKYSYG